MTWRIYDPRALLSGDGTLMWRGQVGPQDALARFPGLQVILGNRRLRPVGLKP